MSRKPNSKRQKKENSAMNKKPRLEKCRKANFPVECLEDIFRHLEGQDLLQCELVSQDWYEFVKSRNSCMEKIKFNIKPLNSRLVKNKTIEKYVNMLSRKKWLQVSLSSENFADIRDFLKVVKIFKSNPKLWCKLTVFEINIEKSYPDLNSFLITQKDSIQVLKLRQQLTLDLMKTIFTIPRLKKLDLGTFCSNDLKVAVQTLPKNLSVTELLLFQDKGNASIEMFLTFFPNVEFLKIPHVDDDTADLISRKAKHLKRLSVKNFFARSISNEAYFLNLEQINCFYTYVFSQFSQKLKQRMKREADEIF